MDLQQEKMTQAVVKDPLLLTSDEDIWSRLSGGSDDWPEGTDIARVVRRLNKIATFHYQIMSEEHKIVWAGFVNIDTQTKLPPYPGVNQSYGHSSGNKLSVAFNRSVGLVDLCKSFLKKESFHVEVKRKARTIKQGNYSIVEVFPLCAGGAEFNFIDRKRGFNLRELKSVFLSFTPEDLEFQGWQLDAKVRLSKILSNGFEKECTVRRDKFPDYGGGNCHHFVNYVVFGFSEQEEFSHNRWFINAPFCEILSYEKTHLEWGDIIQLMKGGELKHSLIFMYDGLFISKMAFNLNVYVQDLSMAKKDYPCDDIRVVRRTMNDTIAWQKEF